MFDIICTFGGSDKFYSILDFQKLPEEEIEKLRHSLLCQRCREKSYYRKKSVSGSAACFGSRYCTCQERTSSPQWQRERQNAVEVDQIIAESDTIKITFNLNEISSEINRGSGVNGLVNLNSSSNNKVYSRESDKKRIPEVSLEKILHSLIIGSGLSSSDTIIPIDGFKYKAKNLFVHFSDAEPLKKKAQRFYWGTLYNSNNNIEWFNPAECKDVGIPLGNFRDTIINRFSITDAECLEGAAIIFSGLCHWNKEKTKKIINIRDSERIFISLPE